MPVCPHCNQDNPRRKKGTCPNCGRPVYTFRDGGITYWVANETSTSALVDQLEEHVRIAWHLPDFTFGEPDEKSRHAQFAMARTLLRRCDLDMELAQAVIFCYFDGSKRLYPVKSMAGVIGKQFQLAKAIAMKKLAEQKEKEKIEMGRAEQTKLMLDVYLGI